MEKKVITTQRGSVKEAEIRENFFALYKNSPIPEKERLSNLGLYMNRQALARVLFLHEIYGKIVDVHGVIMEMGVRWGQNLALFESFRGIYEPYNYSRRIIGFDTWEGFPSVDQKDGDSSIVQKGNYSVTDHYEEYLGKVLDYHEQESPLAHLKRYELVKGDASKTVPAYLKKHPETIVALAFIDLDLYQPTKDSLEALEGHLTKGSILVFDELNCPEFPGETVALKEVFGLGRWKIRRTPLNPLISYAVVE